MHEPSRKRYAILLVIFMTVIFLFGFYSNDLSSISNFSIARCSTSIPHSREEVSSEMKSKEKAKIKMFAFIHTFPASHQTRAKAVEMTWASRLDDYVFSTIEDDGNLTKKWVIAFESPKQKKTQRFWLWDRVKTAFRKMYKEKGDQFDWFMKADDDCYYVIENIRELLSAYNPDEPWFLGEMVTIGRVNPYPSGGTGYILSRAALRNFVEELDSPTTRCRNQSDEMEDVHIGQCFKYANISLIPSVDESGHHNMIPINLKDLLPEVGERNNFNRWYTGSAHIPVKNGRECCGSNLMAVHYVSFQEMFLYDYLLYGVKVSGIDI